MARARNIKPGFFVNEELGQIDPLGRVIFIGLWTLADREGRLEDRPLRIKVTLLPYDNCEVNDLLDDLSHAGFIQRYESDGCKYIQILNFTKHQNPHQNEAASTIPAPKDSGASTKVTREEHRTNPADSLNPITESLSRSFDLFWIEYPKKVKKKTAKGIWKRNSLASKVDLITADIKKRLQSDRRWKEGYIPDPTTYLTQERWDDEIDTGESKVTSILPAEHNGPRSKPLAH